MPAKKGKKKKAKKIKMVGNESPDQVISRVLRTYERNCVQSNTAACASLISALKSAKEDQKLVTKFILEPYNYQSILDPIVALEPLIETMRQERYTFVQDLYLWQLPVNHTQLSTLALMLEKGCYPLKHLELMDCLVEAGALRRLALSFNVCESLSSLVFDYNEFSDAGAKGLCEGLSGNKTVISVSLCFCDLGVASGELLGQVLATTAVREMYLDGNDLECEGVVDLIKVCADHAEVEHTLAIEEEIRKQEEAERLAAEEKEKQSGFRATPDSAALAPTETKGKKKKKKGKKKKSKEPAPPPPVGPWIHKLHLADNGVDTYSATGVKGSIAPMICMRLFRKLLTHSKCLEELDLEDNLIGDMGGRELVEGLEERKEFNLGGVKMRTTHRMNADTFNSLVKLGVGLKKKKKKGKKKKVPTATLR